MTELLKKSKGHHQELEKIIQERDEYLAGWKRAQADYQNSQKEMNSKKIEYSRYAQERILEDLLPIIDHFDEALKHIPEDQKQEAWVVGMFHIKKQMDEFCRKQGLEMFGKVGDEFDPMVHEALGQVDAPEHTGCISAVVRCGYRIGNHIIRHAPVMVGK